MGLRTVTQAQVVAAVMRTIAKQLVRLAATLEVESASSSNQSSRRLRRKSKEDYRGFLDCGDAPK